MVRNIGDSMKNIVKDAKAKVKAEKQAQRKEQRKKVWNVAKHYVIAGVIVAIALSLYQLRVWSYDQGYQAGLKDGKTEASETDQVVIKRVKEIKDLMKELK